MIEITFNKEYFTLKGHTIPEVCSLVSYITQCFCDKFPKDYEMTNDQISKIKKTSDNNKEYEFLVYSLNLLISNYEKSFKILYN